MNEALELSEKVLLLENLLQRITPLRGVNQNSFSLKGTITMAERNAIHTAWRVLRLEVQSRQLRKEKEND